MAARFSLRMRQTTNDDAFPALSPATLRQNIEATIERLLVLLDTLDGDPDLEPDADGEPSLGWTATMAFGSLDDREEDRHAAS